MEPSTTPQPDLAPVTRIQEIRRNIKDGEAWLKTGNYGKTGARWEMWKRNKAWLRCDWNVKGTPEEQLEFHVNVPFANFHTVRPNLIFKTPYINVTAKKPEFVRGPDGNVQRDDAGQPMIASDNYTAARLLQVRVNHELKQMKIKRVIKRCVGHAIGHYGIGWAKVGYQDITVSQFNNDRDNKRNYWVDWVDPRDVVYDWRSVEDRRLRWIAQRITLPRSEVLKMGFKLPENYCGRVVAQSDDRKLQQPEGGRVDAEQGTEDPEIEFWEYHDLMQRTIDWCLLDGPGDAWFYMRDTSEDSYPYEGAQYLPLVLTEDDDDLIGITDIEPVREQVLALNRMRTREVHHMDNYGTMTIMERSAVNPKQKENFRKTPYGGELIVEDGFINKVKIEGTPSLGADHYRMGDVHKEEIRTTLAITDYQQGGADVQRKATEAQIITTAATVRVEDKRDLIAEFVIEIVRRLVAMIQEFDDETDFYNVANEEFDEDFIEVLKNEHGYNPKVPFLGISRAQIQGEFDFDFNIEEMVLQPREVRAAQISRSIQAVSANPLILQRLEQRGFDITDAVLDMFELSGVDIKKYQRNGPAQISAVVENQMFAQGMEVPEPHRKDDDDEHLIVHGQLRRELEAQIQQLTAEVQHFQQQQAMIPDMLAGDPALAAQAQKQSDLKLQALLGQLEPLELMLRRVRLHSQAHDAQDRRKSGDLELMGAGGGGAMAGQLSGQAPQQTDVNMPAQPPSGAPL